MAVRASNSSPGFQNGFFWWQGKVNVFYIYVMLLILHKTSSHIYIFESLWRSQPQKLLLCCLSIPVLKNWCLRNDVISCSVPYTTSSFGLSQSMLRLRVVLSLCSFGTGSLHTHPVSLIQGQIVKLFLKWPNFE